MTATEGLEPEVYGSPLHGNDLVKQTLEELRKQKLTSNDATEFDLKPVVELFTRINEEMALSQPKNVVEFVIDFLCKNYPNHLHGFSSIWNSDPELEQARLVVVEFFKYNKLPVEIASHFTRAGYDTLDTIASLNRDSLTEIEKYSNAEWLPGHKVRLLKMFENIEQHIIEFKRDRPFQSLHKSG
ncbi:uncharacterized protein TOT_010000070 [Theileria orientalis strain Shintoku]|uniref:Uncharacterized protein n=1 Tax=Theileria orientalis strain Shintoku TaxID=869250 RepID=J7MBU4_THEOR|nr:uncharacterized protein TOT_010000070 [Theileria orientalis strain Shintoku]PVC50333.1 hypothetical protein MACL_00002360 [Theileria orientalis]BAM38602.1 uncharacterized protein TOT_010000070 [Theileria orientalis strain Shintoku]|eukprot:XP_009688903.1 uncharacterized protein TOT_010000070 [Theileria orientalis strain Shintoku]